MFSPMYKWTPLGPVGGWNVCGWDDKIFDFLYTSVQFYFMKQIKRFFNVGELNIQEQLFL